MESTTPRARGAATKKGLTEQSFARPAFLSLMACCRHGIYSLFVRRRVTLGWNGSHHEACKRSCTTRCPYISSRLIESWGRGRGVVPSRRKPRARFCLYHSTHRCPMTTSITLSKACAHETTKTHGCFDGRRRLFRLERRDPRGCAKRLLARLGSGRYSRKLWWATQHQRLASSKSAPRPKRVEGDPFSVGRPRSFEVVRGVRVELNRLSSFDGHVVKILIPVGARLPRPPRTDCSPSRASPHGDR